jgi:hypothetical protein
MKKTYILAFIFATFIFALSTSAQGATSTTVVKEEETAFKVNTIEISKIEGSDTTRFTFVPTEIQNVQNIAYWKVRVYCEDHVSITVNDLKDNVCNKVVRIEGFNGPFFLNFNNDTTKTTPFSFKLKAYDKDGNWLHSEKKSFQWK